MKQEIFNKIRKESFHLLILFAIVAILFKIVFYNESVLVVVRTVFAIFWLFVIPGFYLMFYWSNELEFLERVVIGIAVSAAVVGISSYFLGLIGLNLKYHGIILPIFCLVIGFFAIRRKS